MPDKTREARDSSSSASAEDVVRVRGTQLARRERHAEPSQEAQQAERFFDRVSQDKEASIRFLRRAGILNSGGELAKPYRD